MHGAGALQGGADVHEGVAVDGEGAVATGLDNGGCGSAQGAGEGLDVGACSGGGGTDAQLAELVWLLLALKILGRRCGKQLTLPGA